ncbi:hypothetical protein [Spirillospora sp. CA-128828]|uniref:hypothetical protein n=1 Tax=Spirillospora sp. CA-128828 TaxID=3240033 RepID=UPI003D9079F2
MTVILVLLCLAIAGRELYLAFERKRAPGAPEIADIRTQLRALKGTRDELESLRASQGERLDRLAEDGDRDRAALTEADARIKSLITQINDRLLPDVNGRLRRQREAADEQRAAVDRLAAEVAVLRAHLVGRLDQAVAASLGADPADLVAGALTASPAARPALARRYEWLAEQHGLRVELADRDRYYLSGRSPRGLERDFVGLVAALRANGVESTERARNLLGALRDIDQGGAQIGPLFIVRTPEALVCGVLPLAELRGPDAAGLLDDLPGAARRLHRLPETRFCDVSAWPALNG